MATASAARAIPSHTGPPTTTSSTSNEKAVAAPPAPAPSPTLYVSNLPSISQIRKPELRTALYTLFSTYGAVLDVVAMGGARMRGQAHVVFRDANTATQAMRALHGFDFFGRQLRIAYGRGRSKVFERLEGVWREDEVGTNKAEQEGLAKQGGGGPSAFVAPVAGVGAAADAEKSVRLGAAGKEGEAAKGVKRPRDEEEEEAKEGEGAEDQEAPMEEDDDDDDDDDVDMEEESDED